jgi:rod shape-determining protein MreC
VKAHAPSRFDADTRCSHAVSAPSRPARTVSPPFSGFLAKVRVRPGDRVVSSGDGGLFPPDLLVGQVALGNDRRLRVRLAADYERLEFLRVLRSPPTEQISDPGNLIIPEPEAELVPFGPELPAIGDETNG